MAKGTKGFFLWLRAKLPRVYDEVKREFKDSAQLNGIGASNFMYQSPGLPQDPIAVSTEAPASSTLAKTISDIANIAAQAYLTREQAQAQNRILNINLQRAQQGLAPLDINPASYGLQPSVGVGLTSDTKELLMYGGIGVGLLWLLSMATGKRR